MGNYPFHLYVNPLLQQKKSILRIIVLNKSALTLIKDKEKNNRLYLPIALLVNNKTLITNNSSVDNAFQRK